MTWRVDTDDKVDLDARAENRTPDPFSFSGIPDLTHCTYLSFSKNKSSSLFLSREGHRQAQEVASLQSKQNFIPPNNKVLFTKNSVASHSAQIYVEEGRQLYLTIGPEAIQPLKER
jgi:hypothetical protein